MFKHHKLKEMTTHSNKPIEQFTLVVFLVVNMVKSYTLSLELFTDFIERNDN